MQLTFPISTPLLFSQRVPSGSTPLPSANALPAGRAVVAVPSASEPGCTPAPLRSGGRKAVVSSTMLYRVASEHQQLANHWQGSAACTTVAPVHVTVHQVHLTCSGGNMAARARTTSSASCDGKVRALGRENSASAKGKSWPPAFWVMSGDGDRCSWGAGPLASGDRSNGKTGAKAPNVLLPAAANSSWPNKSLN
jgi:hypothetical protein